MYGHLWPTTLRLWCGSIALCALDQGRRDKNRAKESKKRIVSIPSSTMTLKITFQKVMERVQGSNESETSCTQTSCCRLCLVPPSQTINSYFFFWWGGGQYSYIVWFHVHPWYCWSGFQPCEHKKSPLKEIIGKHDIICLSPVLEVMGSQAVSDAEQIQSINNT
jgi:hypothetical protein